MGVLKMNNKFAKKAGMLSAGATASAIGIAASGSSAVAMTSTLATIGGVVGGGMASGILLTSVAPLGVGYMTYRWFKKRLK